MFKLTSTILTLICGTVDFDNITTEDENAATKNYVDTHLYVTSRYGKVPWTPTQIKSNRV